MNWFEPDFQVMLVEMLLLLGVTLVISAIGFYRVVYFLSIGYTFSIVGMAIIAPLRQITNLSWLSTTQNILLIVWGLRLGIYLVQREFRASYRQELVQVHQRSAEMGWSTKVIIWLGVSLLYVLMFLPSLLGLIEASNSSAGVFYLIVIGGLGLMGSGLVLEALADKQKSDFKAQFPGQYCDQGLYGWVRCPNYLGEIIFWVGNWVTGLVRYQTPGQWIASTIGVVCIVLIMIGSTKRLEKTHEERYGDQPRYQEYIRTVPVLFPFVPVYSLKNVRVFLE